MLKTVLSLIGISAAATLCPAQIAITEYPVTTSGSLPYGITAGPDGNIWFTENGANKIGKITPNGVVTEYPIPTAGSSPTDITAGSDNALWFTEYNGQQIGRI